MRCSDVEKFVHPYVDGEFEAEDRELLDRHLAGCDRCRELVAFQQNFRSSLRARLQRPVPPAALHDRIVRALDAADAHGQGPVPPVWRRALPLTAAITVAAGTLVAVGTFAPGNGGSPIVEEAVRAHEKNLPVEVGGTEDNVRMWMAGKVPVPVRPPPLGAQLIGGRLTHLRSRDAAQLLYRMPRTTVTVMVFDPSGLPMSGREKRMVGTREVYLDEARGYNVVFYRDRGVGYALASDLDSDEMLRLVSASFSH